jgi:hypothetical protein
MSHVPVRCRFDPQEEFMRNLKLATGVVLLCSTFVAGAAFADAQTASVTSCLDMAQQVRSALAANAQSPNYQVAVKEQGYGRDFCNNSYYKIGIDHYSHALELLGANKS